jgi:hypothetical protein
VKGDRKGEDAPGHILLAVPRKSEQAAAGAIDVGLASLGDSAEDISPVPHESGHLIEDAAARKPVAGLAEILGCSVIAVEPNTMVVEDLDKDVGADGEGDARVEEVACIHDDRGPEPLGLERTESGKEIVDGTVPLEQVHILGPAEVTLQGCRQDDDWNLGAVTTKVRGDLGAEPTRAKVVIEHGNVDMVEGLGGFLDCGGGNATITVLAQNSGSEVQIRRLVIEQQNADVWANVGHTRTVAWWLANH